MSDSAHTGLYVHVPFCLTRCGYCDFNAYAGMGHLASRYAQALRLEARLRAPDWADRRIGSVFFGGGTPTMLPSQELIRLLEDLGDCFAIDPAPEITVEANPDTVDDASLSVLRAGGVTRLSMGVQSFDSVVLRALERVHGPGSVLRAFAAARGAGFDNVSVDLIFGAQGETLDSWTRTLRRAMDLEPEHLSCYALTVEPATPLGRAVGAGIVPAPDADLQADMFDAACRLLSEAGYDHYEVSNWARPGFECRHNLGYWRREPYLGLGAGAHSFRDDRRWWNLRPPLAYLEAVEAGSLPAGGDEVIGPSERRLEDVFLALRTADGLEPGPDLDERAEPFLDAGILTRRAGRFVLSERGMFLANEVAIELAG